MFVRQFQQKMKIFQRVRKQYAILGIVPSQKPITKYVSFNGKLLFGFLLFGCIFASSFLYIVRVANGFMEHMVCVSAVSANFIIFVCFAAVTFRKTILFESIEHVEQLIDASKATSSIHRRRSLILVCILFLGCKYPQSKRFFSTTRHQIERSSEIIFVVIVKIALQCLILPKCVVSFAVYFITDSGRDSFELPLPLW